MSILGMTKYWCQCSCSRDILEMGLSTQQRFITPLLLEAINSQGKSGSIHDFNGKCLGPLQCLGSMESGGKNELYQTSLTEKMSFIQGKLKIKNLSLFTLHCCKGKRTGWKDLKVPRKYCEQVSCFQCVSVTLSQSGQYVCSQKQKLLECYALLFTHF